VKLTTLRKYLGGPDPDLPRPPLNPSEEIVAEDRFCFRRAIFGAPAAVGPFIFTNQRVIWYADGWMPSKWPGKRLLGELRLSDIRRVGTNGLIGFIFGGTRLKIWTRNGKTHLFWTGRAPLKLWVAALREVCDDRKKERA
jgi:hypothetical protein